MEEKSCSCCCCEEEEENEGLLKIRLGVAGVLFILALAVEHFATALPYAVSIALYAIAYVIVGYDVIISAIKNIFKGKALAEDFLMAVASVCAFCVGEFPEAVAVMWLYQLGEILEDIALDRSRESINSLLDICPDTATVLRNGAEETVAAETVCVGETIVVRPGERIPLDGVIESGESMLDTRALTGESVPRRAIVGDEVLSGCINESGVLTVHVTKAFAESTASKIIELVESAQERKATSENFITKFARYYTPIVCCLALLIALIPSIITGDFATWFYRGCVLLVISCPCALVISIPLTFFGGLGAASRKGVLVKGGNYLEALTSAKTVVFDKTGTLTKGDFVVTEIHVAEEHTKEEVLELAAQIETYSTHPIATAIKAAYGKETPTDQLSNYREFGGKGIGAAIEGTSVLAGNELLLQENGVTCNVIDSPLTRVYVAADGICIGVILIADELKPDAASTIKSLSALGIERTVMLSGDTEQIAASVADELGIDECHANLLPAQKVERLEEILAANNNGSVIYVGDGINDAPVLARADIGIAMGALGSDAAIEAADVVLMTDNMSQLSEALKTAKRTRKIVMQNVVFILAVKIVLLTLGAVGYVGMWIAVFGDVGVMMLAVLNAMRTLKD